MRIQPIGIFTIIGAISGVISYTLATYFMDFRITAGVVFGVALLAAYYFSGIDEHPTLEAVFIEKTWIRRILWLTASFVSYYIAVQATLLAGKALEHTYLAFFAGGVVGAFFMLIGVHLLLQKLSLTQYLLLVVFGGVLGISGVFGGASLIFILYLVWQTGMMAAIGYVVTEAQYEF